MSIGINPQGRVSSESSKVKSKDTPDFTVILLRRPLPDHGMGWWEVKVPTFGLQYVLVSYYRQMLRYAKGMLLGNVELHRIRTIISAGNEFALLEWARPRAYQRYSAPPTSPDLPEWVADHEHDFFADLHEDVQCMQSDSTFAYLQAQNPASLPDEVRSQLDRCRRILSDIKDWNPVVVFFGEQIFDTSSRPSTRFSPTFIHALELLHTPEAATGVPEPQWARSQGSIFERERDGYSRPARSLLVRMVTPYSVSSLKCRP